MSAQRLLAQPVVQLMLARLREFCRQPEAVFWVYVFPMIMVIALGTAFRDRQAERVRVAVADGSAAESSRRALDDQSTVDVVHGSIAECRRLLASGRCDLVVILDGAQDCEFVFDPTRPGSQLARNQVDDLLQRSAGRADPLTTRDTPVSEPGSRYIDFLVPGLIGMGLMGGGMWGVGFAIVDMRIRKLLKLYLATPMRKSHFLAAMMTSRLLFMIPEIFVLLVFARFAFGVANQGSYLAVGAVVLLGALQFAGIGLLIASRAETLETVSGLMNFVMLPQWVAGGIFFDNDRFPALVQPVIGVLPLTPVNRALRAVMQEGQSLTALPAELAIIGLWTVLSFALALRWFRWN